MADLTRSAKAEYGSESQNLAEHHKYLRPISLWNSELPFLFNMAVACQGHWQLSTTFWICGFTINNIMDQPDPPFIPIESLETYFKVVCYVFLLLDLADFKQW